MAAKRKARPAGGHSVSAGGNISGSVITQGDKNRARYTSNLPPASSVDMRKELDAIKAILTTLQTDDRSKITNALDDAVTEVQKEKPDRDEVGDALQRAIKYAKKATGFATAIATLKPHVERAAAWLGTNWHVILNFVRP